MEKRVYKNTKERGITLVALVITVIVLLILAGVAISSIVGEEGIFSKAKSAAEKYNNSAKNEAEEVNKLVSSEYLEEPVSNGNFSRSKGINTPDTSKLPIATTKYVTWTDVAPFTETLSGTVPLNWYDYRNSKWANIKTTSTDGSAEAYWVWIPRFAYKLPENANAKTIEVAFVKGNGTIVINPTTGEEEQAYYATDLDITTDGSGLYSKKTSGAASKWIIHPAFTFGNTSNLSSTDNKQLNGLWIAKYEASSTNPADTNGGSDNTTLKVQVKPSVTSWRYIQAKNSFTVCRAMQNNGGALGVNTGTTTLDSHMMKNMEWAAVAILSQSQFGNYDRGTNTNLQVWNNPNSSYITGSAGASKDLVTTANASCYAYNTANGVKASTTGNVYGVYDMAGGAYEQLAGILTGYASSLGTSVEIKHFDLYTNPGNINTNYEGGKIGDMTRELLPVSLSSWNADLCNFIYSTYPLVYRGGAHSNGTTAGVFNLGCNTDAVNANATFRPTVVII